MIAEEELQALASALERAPEHALDTESNSGFAYREQLCLLQFNVVGEIWLVDLIAGEFESSPVETLRPFLEDLFYGSELVVEAAHNYDGGVGGVSGDFLEGLSSLAVGEFEVQKYYVGGE